MSLDYLVNPNNPAIPAYTQYTANLPPIENLPPVYDVLVTAIQQEAGQSPCWGLGEFNKQINQWLFTYRECKYLGGLEHPANVTDASGNTVDVGLAYSPRKIVCIKPSLGYTEVKEYTANCRNLPPREVSREEWDSRGTGVPAGYKNYVSDRVCDNVRDEIYHETRPGFNYSSACSQRPVYGPDSRRDIDNFEDYEARQKIITDRNSLLQYNLASCYGTGKLNAAGDDLEYTKSDCDMLKGTYDTETKRCLKPFNKPKPHGTGCTDLDWVKVNLEAKEELIKSKLQTDGSFKKGNFEIKVPYQSNWAKKWEDFSRFWGWNGMRLTDIRAVDEWNTYNVGITDEDVDAVKAKYPELVLWTPPPTAEEIAAELNSRLKTTYPEIYNRTTKLRQPLPDPVQMSDYEYFSWDGRLLKDNRIALPLTAEEQAMIDTLRRETKEERTARGDLVINFGLWDDTGMSEYGVDNGILPWQSDLCELMGDTYNTAYPITRDCKTKDAKRFGSVKGIMNSYGNGRNKIYGVPGDYSYPFYARMSELRLFITNDDIEEYKRKFNTDPLKPRTALITPPPPPPPPAPILTPLEEAKKALTEISIISPPPPPPQIPFTIIDAPRPPVPEQTTEEKLIDTPPPPVVKPPETIQEHAKDVEGKIKQLDKTATDYTYYAVVGGLGLAAFFLVK